MNGAISALSGERLRVPAILRNYSEERNSEDPRPGYVSNSEEGTVRGIAPVVKVIAIERRDASSSQTSQPVPLFPFVA